MKTLEHTLGAHPFIEGMASDYVNILAENACVVRFEPGEPIFREGGDADRFYLIQHGKVALEIFHLEHGSIVLQTIGEGEALGWSWLVPPYKWRFDARAVDTTTAIMLDGKRLREECEHGKSLGYELLQRFAQVLEQRLQATRMQLLDLYSTHVV